jgi:hypothetical protein
MAVIGRCGGGGPRRAGRPGARARRERRSGAGAPRAARAPGPCAPGAGAGERGGPRSWWVRRRRACVGQGGGQGGIGLSLRAGRQRSGARGRRRAARRPPAPRSQATLLARGALAGPEGALRSAVARLWGAICPQGGDQSARQSKKAEHKGSLFSKRHAHAVGFLGMRAEAGAGTQEVGRGHCGAGGVVYHRARAARAMRGGASVPESIRPRQATPRAARPRRAALRFGWAAGQRRRAGRGAACAGRPGERCGGDGKRGPGG